MMTADTRAAVVEALRAQIAATERGGRGCSRAPAVPFGIAAIDRHLPAGGLLLGAVHELQASGPDVEVGAAPALFAAGVLARRPGPLVWIGRSGGVFAHGLLQAGLDPRRVVFVDAGRVVLLAMEEALRHPDIGGPVATEPEVRFSQQLSSAKRWGCCEGLGRSALPRILRSAE